MTFLIILDGAEESVSRSCTYSPPAGARMKHLRMLAEHGVSGCTAFFLPEREVDSLSCILTMLGIPADAVPDSRAPLEALGAGIEVRPGDTVYRCNLVSVQNGRLASFNGGMLGRGQMRAFAAASARFVPEGMQLFHLSDYRNLLVAEDDTTAPDVPPPHESLQMPVGQLLAGIPPHGRLSEFIVRSGGVLPGYLLYPWGGGRAAVLPDYRGLTGRMAACVCAKEVMAGIGKALGMTVCIPPGVTGDGDTDLCAKADAALRLAQDHDLVILHVNGTDELAHRHDLQGKIRFLERVDEELIGRMLDGLKENARLLVTSDHVTSSRTGRHEKLPVRWVCSDYYARSSLLVPPQIRRASQDRLFDQILRGKIE